MCLFLYSVVSGVVDYYDDKYIHYSIIGHELQSFIKKHPTIMYVHFIKKIINCGLI